MYYHEPVPVDWFHSQPSNYPPRRPRPPPPMSRPISKSFNRISDFIFPDSMHIGFDPQRQQQQQHLNQRYHRSDNYSLPLLNRHHSNQHDIIILERTPVEQYDNVDRFYHEQYHQPNQHIRRRYSSNIDERRIPPTYGPTNRPIPHRDRRKRHTTDNAYHSMLKSMIDQDTTTRQYSSRTNRDSNYPLSYRTTLEPITDSESMTSIHERTTTNLVHNRVPINGSTIPNITTDRERRKVRQHSSSISSRDSSSDTDITERHPLTLNNTHYQQNSSIWERLPSNDVHHQHERFIPIRSSFTDTNNRMNNSSPFDNVINHQINNRTPMTAHDSTHDVSLCVNDLRTTVFINEETLHKNKSINNGGKAVIKTFIDRLIQRLQHFKRSLDHGLIHVRKPNTTKSVMTTDHETTRKQVTHDQSWNIIDENKSARPYFLIRPQTLLMLPNETAKFKCCFGGDPFPNLVWSHNESRIPEILAAGGTTATRYQTHKLHDIHYMDIGPVRLSDSGQIKCTLMNRFGREEAIAQLLVVPSRADGTPHIVQPLVDVTVVEGQPLKLSCAINGLQVTVNWFHNGKLISPAMPSKNDYHDENTIFTLSRCLRTDAGTIDCLVKNRFGEARSSCRIEVINDSTSDR